MNIKIIKKIFQKIKKPQKPFLDFFIQKLDDILDCGWILLGFFAVFAFCLFLFVPFSDLFIKSFFSESFLALQAEFHNSVDSGIFIPSWTNLELGSPLFEFTGNLFFHITYTLTYLFDISSLVATKLTLTSLFMIGFIGAYLFFRLYFPRIPSLAGALIYAFFPTNLAHVFFVFSPGEILGSMTLIIWLFWVIKSYKTTNRISWGALITVFTALIGLSAPFSLLIWIPFLLLFTIFENPKYTWKISGYFLLGIGFIMTPILNAISQDLLIYVNPNSAAFETLNFNIFSFKYWDITALVNQTFTSIQPLSVGFMAIGIGGILITLYLSRKFVINQILKNHQSKLLTGLQKVTAHLTHQNTDTIYANKYKLALFTSISAIILLVLVAKSSTFLATDTLNIPLSWRILFVIAFIFAIFTAFLAFSWTQKKHYSRIIVLGIFISILWMGNMPYLEGSHVSEWKQYPAVQRTEDFNKGYFKPDLSQINPPNRIFIEGTSPFTIISQRTLNPEYIELVVNNQVAQDMIFLQKNYHNWNFLINDKESLLKSAEKPDEVTAPEDSKTKPGSNLIQFYLPEGEHKLLFTKKNNNIDKIGFFTSVLSLFFWLYIIISILNRNSKSLYAKTKKLLTFKSSK